jgi:hypothetical protein
MNQLVPVSGAEPLYKRAVAIYEKALAQVVGAEPLYKRALAIYEKGLGPSCRQPRDRGPLCRGAANGPSLSSALHPLCRYERTLSYSVRETNPTVIGNATLQQPYIASPRSQRSRL